MWEYVRLEDDTQVSYSEVREDNTVKVVVERPRDWGFDTAECILPAFNWVSHEGFSEADLKELDDFVRNNAPLILRFAYEGGRSMPSLFRLGPYIIFFWTGENGEPVHVHIAVKRPTAEATKIWLTRSGGCKLAHNKGDIPARDLRDIMQFVSSNHALICKRWKETTGGLSFYC